MRVEKLRAGRLLRGDVFFCLKTRAPFAFNPKRLLQVSERFLGIALPNSPKSTRLITIGR
jgi:hypothetical protein